MSDVHERLGHQALGRALTADEQTLAAALERAFKNGLHDFAAVAARLQAEGIPQPRGVPSWDVASLEQALSAINASLDAAYEADPPRA